MTIRGNNLAELAEQELRLPEIDPECCVYAEFEGASCQACVDACPSNAWILGEESLGLDTQACDGCGLCVPACPTGALHIEFPWVIRHFGGKALALFACEQSGLDTGTGIMPCIHALGTRQLMVLHTAGINSLLVSEGSCDSCSLGQGERLTDRIYQLNRLLVQRNLVPIKLLSYSNAVWQKIRAQEEVISKGTLLQRRAFLGGATSSHNLQQQLVVLDPLNRSECQTLPPGTLLTEPEVAHSSYIWPWAPQLEPGNCNGCNACIKLCPTDALTQVDEDEGSRYQVQAQHCTGCNICADVCTEDAINPTAWDTVSEQSIPLLEKQCRSCKNPFHLPAANPGADGDQCPVCNKHQQLLSRQQ